MNILMMTNVYRPLSGGVANSVTKFSDELRRMGHKVLIVSPTFEKSKESHSDEHDVIHVPSMEKALRDKFALPFVPPGYLTKSISEFKPDVIHSHHPFLLGVTALRTGAAFGVPVVYTAHTRYDLYMRYFTRQHSLEMLAREINIRYCSLCDAVIAPSEYMASLIREAEPGVFVDVIPTGVYPGIFKGVDKSTFCKKHDIPIDAFLLGTVGRLEQEKNLDFLAKSVLKFLRSNTSAHFVVIGDGTKRERMQRTLAEHDVRDRVRFVGMMSNDRLAAPYAAFDAFAFASKTETQGIVLIEALASGTPVIALDVPPVDEFVEHDKTGLLVSDEDTECFAEALRYYASLGTDERRTYERRAVESVDKWSVDTTTDALLSAYRRAIEGYDRTKKASKPVLDVLRREGEILAQACGVLTKGVGSYFTSKDSSPK